ncbi:histone-like nucleoid-structuring protein Lsr2 [Streptomyces sp. NPDC085479]|uniref:Lsr2 family DNA-binding protein n=1 Tax=Streptomyces sp. NPDC085479 TaxID=3365726 RepID=UPI0037CD16D5
MFTDLTVSTRAGALSLTPTTEPQLAAAARTVAHHARDTTDLALLLDVLGLPAPRPLPETGDPTTMTTPGTLSAHESVALSMHADGASEQAIREATGLTEAELSDLIADKVLDLPHASASPTPAIDVPVIPLSGSDSLQQLIEWAAAHPAASVRKSAARITTALTELSARRDSEAAQREAEARVAEARQALEQAEQELRTVKAGTRTTTTAATAPTPIRTGTSGTYSRDELTRIRTWARANGRQVADRGLPPKTVLDAYTAAHPAAPARKAG